MIEIPTVDRLDLLEQRVFYRVDYNVPVEDGRITDATRIEETEPTLMMLRERGARIVLASHFGRPKGTRNEKYSLRPVAEQASEILGFEVQFADDCIGAAAEERAAALKPGEVLLLENLRFHPGEEKNDGQFAAALRRLGDFYINDAFGASHRAHASIDALPRLFPKERVAGGLLLVKELEFLQKITEVTDRPFVALLGGAKIAGKIEPLEALVKLADTILIGGGMANTFLAAQGKRLGASLVDKESIEVAKRILGGGARASIELPTDLVVTDSIDSPSTVATVGLDGVEEGRMAVDIGPATVARYREILAGAKVIFWNGPMGVFENEQFANGTMEMARAVGESNAISVVGGGESVEAVKESGYAERITHISTGGGASLEFIAGESLPGIAVLQEALVATGN
jgi:phosphoglycerate kinase